MRPTVDDESLGIRLHEVNRQRAIDRSVERLRHGLRADWHYLTADDHQNLRWILGEMWSVTGRDEWDSLHFSKLGLEQVRRLATMGDRLHRHGDNKMLALSSASAIVRGVAWAQASAGNDSASMYTRVHSG